MVSPKFDGDRSQDHQNSMPSINTTTSHGNDDPARRVEPSSGDGRRPPRPGGVLRSDSPPPGCLGDPSEGLSSPSLGGCPSDDEGDGSDITLTASETHGFQRTAEDYTRTPKLTIGLLQHELPGQSVTHDAPDRRHAVTPANFLPLVVSPSGITD